MASSALGGAGVPVAQRRLLRRQAHESCEGGAPRRSRASAPIVTYGWTASSALPVATRRRGPRTRAWAARLEVSAISKQPDVGPACDKRRERQHDAREGAHEDWECGERHATRERCLRPRHSRRRGGCWGARAGVRAQARLFWLHGSAPCDALARARQPAQSAAGARPSRGLARRAQACPPRQFRPIKREPSGALLRRHLPIGTVEAARWRLPRWLSV